MTREEIRALVLGALGGVAPEIDTATIDARVSLREQCDLDSVDYLNFLVAVHAATGVDIPEADYAKLEKLDDVVEYVAAQRGGTAG
jgi:acyl carrier protein